jgi:hypothetical protein
LDDEEEEAQEPGFSQPEPVSVPENNTIPIFEQENSVSQNEEINPAASQRIEDGSRARRLASTAEEKYVEAESALIKAKLEAGTRTSRTSIAGYPITGPLPVVLISPFPESSYPTFSPAELKRCLDDHLPAGCDIKEISDQNIALIKVIAGQTASLRSIVRERFDLKDDDKQVEKMCNKLSMREQRFRNENGILMGHFRLRKMEKGKAVVEQKTKAKLERLSEAQLLHQTWGEIDLIRFKVTCLDQEFELREPRVMPYKIQNALDECGLRVPDLEEYLDRNPRVRQHFWPRR